MTKNIFLLSSFCFFISSFVCMLSLQFIRENPDIVRAAIQNKSVKVDFDAFLAIDDKRKPLQQQVE
jgi:hypothetical protein